MLDDERWILPEYIARQLDLNKLNVTPISIPNDTQISTISWSLIIELHNSNLSSAYINIGLPQYSLHNLQPRPDSSNLYNNSSM